VYLQTFRVECRHDRPQPVDEVPGHHEHGDDEKRAARFARGESTSRTNGTAKRTT
jgi:hypothetical protein